MLPSAGNGVAFRVRALPGVQTGKKDLVMKLTNILAASAMAATALATPMATSAQSASAGTSVQVSTAQTVSYAHPCKYHKKPKKCRARGHGGAPGGEGKIKIDIRIDNQKPDKEVPKQGEPKQGEPKQGEPKQGEPKQGEPKQGEPKQGEAGPNKGGGIDIR
jgi:hypothetical protein